MSGRALAEKLRLEKPALKIIFTSGYPKDVLGEDLTLERNFYFLQKPYAPQKLAQVVRACLDGKSPPL
jgi:hypothetical protein